MEKLSSFLEYGAIGLGLALAVLAFMLLRKEQDMKNPRKEIIRAIYVFMVFALSLAMAGLIDEFMKADAVSNRVVNSQVEKKNTAFEQLEEKPENVMKDKLDQAKEITDGQIQNESNYSPLFSNRSIGKAEYMGSIPDKIEKIYSIEGEDALYYKFTVRKSGNVDLTIADNTKDLNLSLMTEDQNIIKEKKRIGLYKGTVAMLMTKGDYYLKITCYSKDSATSFRIIIKYKA